MVSSIAKHMSEHKYISCTADIWSKDLRSFLAVNAHWIDKENGKLKTALLACERFKGSQTGDAIAKKLKGDIYLYNTYIHIFLDFIRSFQTIDF